MLLVGWLVSHKVSVKLRNEVITQQAIKKAVKQETNTLQCQVDKMLSQKQKGQLLRSMDKKNDFVAMMYEHGMVHDVLEEEIYKQLPKSVKAIWPTICEKCGRETTGNCVKCRTQWDNIKDTTMEQEKALYEAEVKKQKLDAKIKELDAESACLNEYAYSDRDFEELEFIADQLMELEYERAKLMEQIGR